MANGVQETQQPHWRWDQSQVSHEEAKSTWPREKPQAPELGQGWYDERADSLCVWDGEEWVCIPSD